MGGYADKLKKNTDKIKTEEKIFDEKKPTKKNVGGRPKKASKKDVRNIPIPVALNQKEKEWIEEQASNMSKQLNIKVPASTWMRMKILADMPKDEEE